ncbi:hypothetical protein BST92_12850 [Nonlabens arenilitoris]|uniref:DUF4252 domain-containing protein n=1 Tax=Nonlabens arenilitoris TaxID=1217969 RepID=A0A2S7UEN7_9FLAO|nr:hypothetical protein [Nonlabens arenilitoris]PQJ32753.1 hypothetical protein BST92_12850 [Nonlabens arenilitoris]
MKNITTALLLLLFFQLSTAQNETVNLMKKKAYELIEDISDREAFGLSTYKSHMVSLILLNKAADSPDLLMSDEDKEIIKAVSRTRYAELLKEDHDGIRDAAQKLNINWKKVEYVDLLYKTRAIFKLGQPGYEGLLIFKDKSQKDVLFTLHVDFIMLGTEPYIIEMVDLKKEDK